MSVKLLTEHLMDCLGLTGGCTGSSESTLVKMPHCWKSHVLAHLYVLFLCVIKTGTAIIRDQLWLEYIEFNQPF